MSRIKPEKTDSSRGRPIALPAWWLEVVNEHCAGRSHQQIADELTAATRRDPPFRREVVGDFLNGKVTTDVVMGAFIVLFPEIPPPMFFASSYEEAMRFQQLSRLYAGPVDRTPKVSETIEDTRDRTKTGEKTRTGKRVAKQAK
jgi:hypothetical protein